MHVLVATDGTLDPERAADAVTRWYNDGDAVTVFTVMNIPTDFLRRLGKSGVEEAASIALEAGQGFTSGDRAAERLARPPVAHAEPLRDSPVMRALAKTAAERTAGIADVLAARGIPASTDWTTTDNRTAKAILLAIAQHGSDLLIIGSHGHGRFEGLLGSTGTKLVRHSPAAVLVIRQPVGAG